MAVALVGSVGAVTLGAVGAAITPAWGASENRTAGNLLVLWVAGHGSATLPAAITGWTIAKQIAGTSCSSSIYYRVATGTDSAPTVALISSCYLQGRLAEFSGVLPSGAESIDQTGSGAGTGSTITAANAGADGQVGDLVIVAGTSYYSAAASKTINHTVTGGTTTITSTNNNGTSLARHYNFGYGPCTSKAGAESDSYAQTTTSITGGAVTIASFKVMVTVSPPAATVTTSGKAPTASPAMFPSSASVTASGKAPSITAFGIASVSPSQATATGAGYGPTVLTNVGTSVNPSAATVTVIVNAPSPYGSHVYYIAPAGNDSTGDGSIGKPWRTLSKFYSVATPGDALWCRGGTYSGTSGTYVTTSGASGAPITVAAYPSEIPVFDGGSVAGSFALAFRSAYHVIDGLRFSNFRPTLFAVINYKDAGTVHHIVRNSRFSMAANGGSTTSHAIYTEAYVDDVLIEGNTFLGKYPSEATGSALEVYHSPGATNIVFRRNICDGWTRAVQLWDTAMTGEVTHNTFLHSYDHIQAYNHSTLLVRDNAGDTADDANFTDPNNSAYTTADHNYWTATFTAGTYSLTPDSPGKAAASDGTDAGALLAVAILLHHSPTVWVQNVSPQATTLGPPDVVVVASGGPVTSASATVQTVVVSSPTPETHA